MTTITRDREVETTPASASAPFAQAKLDLAEARAAMPRLWAVLELDPARDESAGPLLIAARAAVRDRRQAADNALAELEAALEDARQAAYWPDALAQYAEMLERAARPASYAALEAWLSGRMGREDWLAGRCTQEEYLGGRNARFRGEAAAWAYHRRRWLAGWRASAERDAAQGRRLIGLGWDALAEAKSAVAFARLALTVRAKEAAKEAAMARLGDAEHAATFAALLRDVLAQTGQTLPKPVGRRGDPAFDWAWLQEQRGRPRAEVYAEWRARPDVAVKGLADPWKGYIHAMQQRADRGGEVMKRGEKG